jgi:hypothetical protein
LASAEEIGQTQICFSDSARSSDREVGIYHSTPYSQASKAIVGANFTALPFAKPTNLWVNENGYIVVKFYPTVTGDIIESEESDFNIGLILKNKRTGATISRMLTLADFVGFTPAGTVDSVALPAQFLQICTYQIPVGFMATIDPSSKIHIYWGDDS